MSLIKKGTTWHAIVLVLQTILAALLAACVAQKYAPAPELQNGPAATALQAEARKL